MTATAKDAQQLRIYLLGNFRVLLDEREITRQIRPKSRALLKALAANTRGLSKDALSELLWPETYPSSSHLSLKVETHNLRRTLGSKGGDSWILVRDGMYRLNMDRSIWIDVDGFEELFRVGKRAEERGDTARARERYEAALDLYTGDYLEDDVYEDSALVVRERLRDLHLELLGRLARIAYKARDHAGTIGYCHQIVLADPCREDAYQLLIVAHAAMRQFSRAGAWYAVARQTVKRELDRDVSKRTREVFENLFIRDGASIA
jgi:DNA-binding SARP family transcriptional activator